MKLSELREHTRSGRWAEPHAMTWRLDIDMLQELMVDIEKDLIQAYHNGCKDAESKAQARWERPYREVFEKGYNAGFCAHARQVFGDGPRPARMVSEDLGEHDFPKPSEAEARPSGEAVISFPKVAYSVEESDARLKLLTDKLFSVVQRMEVLEREVATKQSTIGHVADVSNINKRFANVDANHSATWRRLDALEQHAQLNEQHGAALADVRGLRAEMDKRFEALQPWGANASETRQALTARLRALEAWQTQVPKAIDALRADVGIYREGVAVGVKGSGNEALLRRVHELETRLDSYRGVAVIDGVDQLKALEERISNMDKHIVESVGTRLQELSKDLGELATAFGSMNEGVGNRLVEHTSKLEDHQRRFLTLFTRHGIATTGLTST